MIAYAGFPAATNALMTAETVSRTTTQAEQSKKAANERGPQRRAALWSLTSRAQGARSVGGFPVDEGALMPRRARRRPWSRW